MHLPILRCFGVFNNEKLNKTSNLLLTNKLIYESAYKIKNVFNNYVFKHKQENIIPKLKKLIKEITEAFELFSFIKATHPISDEDLKNLFLNLVFGLLEANLKGVEGNYIPYLYFTSNIVDFPSIYKVVEKKNNN